MHRAPCGAVTGRWMVLCMRAMQVGMVAVALESAGGSARATVVGADAAEASAPNAPRPGQVSLHTVAPGTPVRTTARTTAGMGNGAARNFSFAACQAQLADDPDGTRDYADDWQDHGGGAEAEYCGALADMALGDVGDAAATLDRLSRVAHWPQGWVAPSRHPPLPPVPSPSVPSRAVTASRGDTTPQPAGVVGGAQQNGTQAGIQDGTQAGPHDTPESLRHRAHVAEEAARAWQANDSPRQALDSATYGLWLDPHDMTLRVIHARLCVDMGMAQQAVADLTPLPGDTALRVDALVTRAAANRALGHIDLAATDIAAALQLSPHNVAAELECGILHERQGRMEDARADWQQVIALAPDSHEADLARQDLSLLEADPAAP